MNKIYAAAALSFLASSDAFTVPSSSSRIISRKNFANSSMLRMSADDEVEKLRAAAAKAREEAQALEKAMGKEVTDTTATATQPVKKEIPVLSADDVKSTVSSINFEAGNAEEQASSLDSLVEDSKLGLWKAALTTSVNTNSPAPIRPFPVSLNFLEQRTGGKITSQSLGVGAKEDVSLDDFKYATLGVTLGCSVLGVLALAFLPPNIGATICYLVALIPILFLAVGSTAPGIIAGAIKGVKETKEDQLAQEDRVCRHEAAHFLCGYVCGLPIKSYSVNDLGVPCVEFYTSGEGNIAREYSPEEVAIMAVVAMSGSVAEALQFEEAKGGQNDLIELNGIFSRSSEFMGAEKQQDMTRWGAYAAYQIITANKDKFEKLVDAFKQKKPVAECIAAIEGSS